MSASPMARQVTGSQAMPIKRVVISDPMDLPVDYSSTPGGTLFSTTPGGSKIVYERSFLINLRNSPIAKTPPKWDIPENLIRGSPTNKWIKPTNPCAKKNNNNRSPNNRSPQNSVSQDDSEQFQMDM